MKKTLRRKNNEWNINYPDTVKRSRSIPFRYVHDGRWTETGGRK